MEVLGLAGAPLGLGAASGGKKGLGAIVGHIQDITQNINLVVNIILIFLSAILVVLFIIGIKRFFSYLRRMKINAVKILLLKLQTDLITFKNIEKFDEQHRLYISQAIQETVGSLKNQIEKNLFYRKFGKNFPGDIIKKLDNIVNNKIDVQDQIQLVDYWIRFFSTF